MRSPALRRILTPAIVFLVFGEYALLQGQSNQCKCAEPPGGTVTCEKDQIPICIVKDGKVTSECRSRPSDRKTVAQQNAWLLSIVLGKKVTVSELLRSEEYQKILLESRWGSASAQISFLPFSPSIKDLPSGPMLRIELRGSSGAAIFGVEVASLYSYERAVTPSVVRVARPVRPGPRNPLETKFDSYFTLGTDSFNQKRFTEALEAFVNAQKIALELNSKDDLVAAYQGIGDTCSRMECDTDPRDAYQAAIKLAPQDPFLWAGMGRLAYVRLNYPEAEAALKKAINLNPRDKELYGLLGSAMIFQQKYAEAEDFLRMAVRLNPIDSDAFFALGVTLATQREHQAASEAFETTIKLKPDDATAYANLGSSRFQLGQFADAEIALKKAIELKPNSAPFHAELGRVWYTQLKYVNAEQAFRQALKTRRPGADLHAALGNALYAQGKNAEAASEYRKAALRDPNNPIYQERLKQTQVRSGRRKK